MSLAMKARQRAKKRAACKDKVFGCDLLEHLNISGLEVPQVLKSCTEFVEEHGIVDGIYRLCGIASNVQKLRQEFDMERSSAPDLNKDTYLQDVHCVSSLCKAYFRELPNPLLTYQLYDKFADAVAIQLEEHRLVKIKEVLKELPSPHYRTLEYLMRHLVHMASFSSQTNMHARNLAIVWAPNLLRSKDIEASGFNGTAAFMEVRIQSIVVEFILTHVEQLFGDVPLVGKTAYEGSTPVSLNSPTCRHEDYFRSLSYNVPSMLNHGDGPPQMRPYHTIIEMSDHKRKGSLKSKKWKSIFNLGRSNNDSKRKANKQDDNENKFGKLNLRPAKSMDSLTSVPYTAGEDSILDERSAKKTLHIRRESFGTQSKHENSYTFLDSDDQPTPNENKNQQEYEEEGLAKSEPTTPKPVRSNVVNTLTRSPKSTQNRAEKCVGVHISGPFSVTLPFHITSNLSRLTRGMECPSLNHFVLQKSLEKSSSEEESQQEASLGIKQMNSNTVSCTSLDINQVKSSMETEASLDINKVQSSMGPEAGLDINQRKSSMGTEASLDINQVQSSMGPETGLDINQRKSSMGTEASLDINQVQSSMGPEAGLDINQRQSSMGTEASLDINQVQSSMGPEAGLDINQRKSSMGTEASLDINQVQSSMGPEDGLDINQRQSSMGTEASLDINQVQSSMGPEDGLDMNQRQSSMGTEASLDINQVQSSMGPDDGLDTIQVKSNEGTQNEGDTDEPFYMQTDKTEDLTTDSENNRISLEVQDTFSFLDNQDMSAEHGALDTDLPQEDTYLHEDVSGYASNCFLADFEILEDELRSSYMTDIIRTGMQLEEFSVEPPPDDLSTGDESDQMYFMPTGCLDTEAHSRETEDNLEEIYLSAHDELSPLAQEPETSFEFIDIKDSLSNDIKLEDYNSQHLIGENTNDVKESELDLESKVLREFTEQTILDVSFPSNTGHDKSLQDNMADTSRHYDEENIYVHQPTNVNEVTVTNYYPDLCQATDDIKKNNGSEHEVIKYVMSENLQEEPKYCPVIQTETAQVQYESSTLDVHMLMTDNKITQNDSQCHLYPSVDCDGTDKKNMITPNCKAESQKDSIPQTPENTPLHGKLESVQQEAVMVYESCEDNLRYPAQDDISQTLNTAPNEARNKILRATSQDGSVLVKVTSTHNRIHQVKSVPVVPPKPQFAKLPPALKSKIHVSPAYVTKRDTRNQKSKSISSVEGSESSNDATQKERRSSWRSGGSMSFDTAVALAKERQLSQCPVRRMQTYCLGDFYDVIDSSKVDKSLHVQKSTLKLPGNRTDRPLNSGMTFNSSEVRIKENSDVNEELTNSSSKHGCPSVFSAEPEEPTQEPSLRKRLSMHRIRKQSSTEEPTEIGLHHRSSQL
ncbi:LOW QUALITY PROTEIN: rho GTPase-activating protein 30 [Rhinophrynus dorsalis]